jgi:hypothetical protein
MVSALCHLDKFARETDREMVATFRGGLMSSNLARTGGGSGGTPIGGTSTGLGGGASGGVISGRGSGSVGSMGEGGIEREGSDMERTPD